MSSASIQHLLSFLKKSPTPFHAVENMMEALEGEGFMRLHESDSWQLKKGTKYVVTRNDSSLVAFVWGEKEITENGFRMIGTHTDSPCLKVKPNPEITTKGFFQLGIEVYGGALLNPWFDRDLSLAGRVSYLDSKGALKNAVIDFEKPLAFIPSLAIHLDREANKNRSINPQKHLPPILLNQVNGEKVFEGKSVPDFKTFLLKKLSEQDTSAKKVLDYELSFYDAQAPAVIGMNDEFVASARLDNLLSCFVGLQAMLSADTEQSCLLVCNDHEEVGSQTASGADGTLLKSILERCLPDVEQRARAIDHSFFISADNAHAVHPNHADKHDAHHGPIINGGPVIKVNASQRYASNSETQALFRYLCEQESVPVQSFVVRSDMACGSTIGPITAAAIGVKTVDVGIAQLGMHSIRELCGVEDPDYLCRVFKRYIRG